MKKFYPFFILIVLATSLLSCQKSLHWPPEEQPLVVQVLPETDCKPAVFGLNSEPASGNSWIKLAQKWYSNNKLTYLKAFIGESPTFAGPDGMEPALTLDWAQVTYDGNQAYLKDAVKNKVVMRVTINGQGRAEASYYRNETNNADGAYQYDTTYYYSTGLRLDSTVSIYETLLSGTTPFNGWQKYIFKYDEYGNIIKIEGFPIQLKLNFEYDLSKPLSGIISNYHLNTPIKLVEYMELVRLPMHHALVKFEVSNNGTILQKQEYQDYQIDKSNLVHSYVMTSGSNKYTFYNGWDCGMVNTAANVNGAQFGISSRDEFIQRYPFRR